MNLPRKWQLLAEWSRNFTRQIYQICQNEGKVTLEGVKRSVYNLSSNIILKNSEKLIQHLTGLCNIEITPENETIVLRFAQAVFGHIDCLEKCFRPIEPAKVCAEGISEAIIVSAWEFHTFKGRKHLFVCKIVRGPGSQGKFRLILPVEIFPKIVNRSKGLGIKAHRIRSRPKISDVIGCGLRCQLKENTNRPQGNFLFLKEFKILPITQSIAKYNRSIYFARKREVLPCPKGKKVDCCGCGVDRKDCSLAWKGGNVIIGKNCPVCLRSGEWFDLNITERMCLSCWLKRHLRTQGYLIKPRLDFTPVNIGEKENEP